ncbi:hypothetical protein VNO78_05871 [Psophocarpus tetragonolobus]|uniref:Uncharacterized protein n=1 Tax=Psophocarpus tetragonolobus TaxID=3891 RepID=A0AAN9XR72_PSOTE
MPLGQTGRRPSGRDRRCSIRNIMLMGFELVSVKVSLLGGDMVLLSGLENVHPEDVSVSDDSWWDSMFTSIMSWVLSLRLSVGYKSRPIQMVISSPEMGNLPTCVVETMEARLRYAHGVGDDSNKRNAPLQPNMLRSVSEDVSHLSPLHSELGDSGSATNRAFPRRGRVG